MTMENNAARWRTLARFTGNGQAGTDEAWLTRCLARNAGTAYGRACGFSGITDAAAYRSRVPLVSYETFAPFISRMAVGERDLLFRGLPVALETTSGSTGPTKYVPYSAESLEDFRTCMLPWLGDLVRRHGLSGTLYWSISPALRRPAQTPGGIPLGLDDAAYLGGEAAGAVAALSAVPFWVGKLEDADAWRTATLYHLVRAHDLSFVSVWSPTFFTRLLDALLTRAENTADLLRSGGNVQGHTLVPDTEAATRLERFVESGGDTRRLWPCLRLVSAWADASAAPYFTQLRQRLPRTAFEAKGLLATEAAVTVPGEDGLPYLPEGCGFTEFLTGGGHCLLPGEIRKNREYRVVLTTAGGLYRSVTDDVVRCLGFARNGRPLLRFVGRYGEGCDLAGEKLTEPFAASCLEGIAGFRTLVPLQSAKPGYLLVLETTERGPDTLRRNVETALCANPHYAYARRMGQLEPLRAVVVPDALERFLAALPAGRQAVAKTPAVAPRALWGATWLEPLGDV